MKNLSKKEIIQKVIELLSENVKILEGSLTGINDSINDAPGAMQSHSDTTRSQLTSVMNTAHKSFNEKIKELEYLKEFSKKDLTEIRFKEARIGVIVVLEKENGAVENYFLLPGGSGIKLDYKGEKLVCITPSSPLGKALIGKKKDENFLLNMGNISQKIKIVDLI